MQPHGFLAPPTKPAPRTQSPSNMSSGHPILGNRPLSDIREITEPSLLDSTRRKAIAELQSSNKQATPLARNLPGAPNLISENYSTTQPGPSRIVLDRPDSRQGRAAATPQRPSSRRSRWSPDRSTDNDTTKSSLYSINPKRVPPRSSSKTPSKARHRPSHSISREPAVGATSGLKRSFSNRRKSNSPLKNAAERVSRDQSIRQRVPSKTFVKVDSPTLNDILHSPIYHHPRVQVEIQMAASLFVGGSTVEGIIRIVIDEATRLRHKKTLTLERLSVDLLGVEEVFGNKRSIFLSLANELVDNTHPPPGDMVESHIPQPAQGHSWLLIPSTTRLPFLLTLPLDVGPPPFKSKHASIRYLLSATLTLKDTGRQLCVRSTQETSVLSVYDPERALVSLPSPLTSSDEVLVHRGREKVTVAAGLHRQVWVNSTTLFADIHINNSSRKHIKRIELHLEQIILFYRHAAASTLEQSASQARLFDETERTTICKSVVKQHHLGWPSVSAYSTDLRTCSIDLPRGYATIKCNKYFEVRYLLNVIVPVSYSLSGSKKTLMIQLPIILIHMSSLDVPTNSVAQVAAAIEEKRNPGGLRDSTKQKAASNSIASSTAADTTASDAAAARGSPQRRPGRKASQNLQGRAFAAPRAASIERSRAHQQDLQALGNAFDKSPRKFQGYQRAPRQAATNVPVQQAIPSSPPGDGEYSYRTPPQNRKGTIIRDDDAEDLRMQLGSDDTTRSFKVLQPSSEQRVAERRDPPRSASAMGYYMPGDRAGKENRRPSHEGRRPSMETRRPSTEAHGRYESGRDMKEASRGLPRRSAESTRPKMKEWRDGGRSPVGGVQLAGVPEAPSRVGGQKRPEWSERERERWRPHWL